MLVDDPTVGDVPDLDARVGWLLAVSRLARPESADGAEHVRRLAEAGVRVSRSQVSRWESGAAVAPLEAVLGYEQVLGLPEGQLVGAVATLRDSHPERRSHASPRYDVADPGFGRRLDELIERAEDGRASPGDWYSLGRRLVACPHVHLRGQTWDLLTRRLVRRLPLATGPARLLLTDAGRCLGDLPAARDRLLDEVANLVDARGSQVITTPVDLLERVPGPRAAGLLLSWFEETDRLALAQVTTSVITRRLVEGTLTPEERARVGLQVLRAWRARPDLAATVLAGLVQVLPSGLREPLHRAAESSGHQAIFARVSTPLSQGPAAVAAVRTVVEQLAPATRGRPDPLVVRLVREVLHHRHVYRREEAAVLLAASPYRSSVADGILTVVERSSEDAEERLPGAWSLQRLAGPEHRMRLMRLAARSEPVTAGLVNLAVAQLPHDQVTDHVLRRRLDEENLDIAYVGGTTLLALGRTRSSALRGIERSPVRPAWQREAAAWWLSLEEN